MINGFTELFLVKAAVMKDDDVVFLPEIRS